MSNAVKVFTSVQQDDSSFHAALAECLSGEAKQRLLGLVKMPSATESSEAEVNLPAAAPETH